MNELQHGNPWLTSFGTSRTHTPASAPPCRQTRLRFRALLFTSLAIKRRQTMASKLHLRQDIDIADVLARRHLEVAGTKPSQSLHRTVAVRSGAIPELAHIRAAHKVTGALRFWPSAPSSPRTSPPPQQRAFPFKSWNRNSSAAHGPSSRMTCSS